MQKSDLVGKASDLYNLKTWGLCGRVSERMQFKASTLQCSAKKEEMLEFIMGRRVITTTFILNFKNIALCITFINVILS